MIAAPAGWRDMYAYWLMRQGMLCATVWLGMQHPCICQLYGAADMELTSIFQRRRSPMQRTHNEIKKLFLCSPYICCNHRSIIIKIIILLWLQRKRCFSLPDAVSVPWQIDFFRFVRNERFSMTFAGGNHCHEQIKRLLNFKVTR